MARNFQWKCGQDLPLIKPHTERKLEVIERYLDVYFETVAKDPRIDTLRISIVDGFCGGGTYQHGSDVVFGSPLVLLRAVQSAQIKLNVGRQKPIDIRARFYFSDSKRDHVEMLKDTLRDSEFSDLLGKSVFIQTGEFKAVLPSIIDQIRSSQRAGRSLFILDQWGYADVPMASLRSIFQNLGKAEVILTFSIDALLNYLRADGAGAERLQQFGVDKGFLAQWNARKSDDAFGRTTAQRALMKRLHENSGALFFTPFMLFSSTDNRWMMLAHLSQHQKARDKMLSVHWALQNRFKHIGRGSLFELGFDHRLNEDRNALFSFTEHDKSILKQQLEAELPDKLFEMMPDNSLSVSGFLHGIGNNTAAQNTDILDVMGKLAQEKVVEIVRANGAIKRPDTRVALSDTLTRPMQRSFSFP